MNSSQQYLQHPTELQVQVNSRSQIPQYPMQECPLIRVFEAGTDNASSTFHPSPPNKQSQLTTLQAVGPLLATFASTTSYSPLHPKI